MPIHPIENRYGRKEVRDIFDQERKLQYILNVEAALAKAHAKVKNIPPGAAEEISKKASTKYVKIERVAGIESEINHDVMAVVKALSEQCVGGADNYVHLGATSNDILDTSLALQLKDYIKYLEEDLSNLKKTLIELAKQHKRTICIGRTHGQHAVPTTYGLKFAIWLSEVQRHMDRLAECKKRVLVGKMTGAVGTQAALGKEGGKIQRIVMSELELNPVDVSNQVIQRDRYAEFIMDLALIAASLDKFAIEIRNLQRTEIDEVREYFEKKQVGSSTMPQKRNPIYSERICGLSRIIRAQAIAELENIPLWHERDLTNSSPERIIIPESCILTDYILNLTIKLLKNLKFNNEKIRRNLDMTGGLALAESVMIALTRKGVGRQEAHEMVRECAMKSYNLNKQFRDILLESKEIRQHLSEKEIKDALKPENYIGTAVEQVDTLIAKLGN